VGALEEAAEIFFAGLDEGTFAGIEADHGFVFDGEALEFDDADIFAALFPDLTLAEFHERGGRNGRRGLSLRTRSGETATRRNYFFFFLADFLAAGFLAAVFLDLVAIVIDCCNRLTASEGQVSPKFMAIMRGNGGFVNK